MYGESRKRMRYVKSKVWVLPTQFGWVLLFVIVFRSTAPAPGTSRFRFASACSMGVAAPLGWLAARHAFRENGAGSRHKNPGEPPV